MKHVLWVVGLVALVPALVYFNKFYTSPTGTGRQNLIIALVFFVVSLGFFAVFFFKQFRSAGEQDISITKF